MTTRPGEPIKWWKLAIGGACILVMSVLLAGAITLSIAMNRVSEQMARYNNGPHESMLRIGQAVMIFSEHGSLVPFGRSRYPRDEAIGPGTRCIVIHETAGDLDDCVAHRDVGIRVEGGDAVGRTGYVERSYLRVIPEQQKP